MYGCLFFNIFFSLCEPFISVKCLNPPLMQLYFFYSFPLVLKCLRLFIWFYNISYFYFAPMFLPPPPTLTPSHRRWKNTEEKAKVVPTVWGTERVYSLPRLLFLLDNRTFLTNRMNSPFSSNRPSAIHSILQIVLFQASAARNLINSVPKQQRRPLPFLLSLSFFYVSPPPPSKILRVL